jgi:hypothetical protein
VKATQPNATANSDASAAPATPSGWPVSQPNISVGARRMLRTTVATWMAVGTFTSPSPRSAAPIPTSVNWRESAGTNQVR